MVINREKYYQFLQSPDSILYSDTLHLEKIIQKYPYFQSALILYVKTLKQNNILHNRFLYKAGALTTDRAILFRFMEDIENFSATKKKNLNQDALPKQKKQIESSFSEKKSISKIVSNQHPTPSDIKKITPKTQSIPKKMSYSEWLRFINESGNPKTQKQDPVFELVDKFLKEKPKIVPKRNTSVPPPQNVIKSVEEKQMLMTETLANLYVKQKKYQKAIQAFKILSLKYPKKSSYFANRINELKKQLKK